MHSNFGNKCRVLVGKLTHKYTCDWHTERSTQVQNELKKLNKIIETDENINKQTRKQIASCKAFAIIRHRPNQFSTFTHSGLPLSVLCIQGFACASRNSFVFFALFYSSCCCCYQFTHIERPIFNLITLHRFFSLFSLFPPPPQISDLKRLNKIEKEIEIHARKTIKVPINAHTILLNTANFDELPIVHKSGQSSPHHGGEPSAIYTSGSSSKDLGILTTTTTIASQQQQPHHLQQQHQQLYPPQNSHYPNHNHQLPNKILDEKLLVASVSLAANNINRTKNGGANIGNRLDGPDNIDDDDEFSFTDPLIGPSLNSDACELYTTATTATGDPDFQRGPHAIRGTPRSEFACSGSDCDISWICLLIFILALCFAIPLIYIIYIAEHPEQFHKENEQLGTVGWMNVRMCEYERTQKRTCR